MSNFKSILFLTVSTLILLIIIELVSYAVLLPVEKKLPFLLNTKKDAKVVHRRKPDEYVALDPHLGYAHHFSESKIRNLSRDYTWVDGFVIYRHSPDHLKKPIILTLGGSTTDGINYGHSWPEELQRILNSKGITATVINGGTGGYSTNQELIKLLRDGLSFDPDIVISYSGVNDRGEYSELPYPMIHSYQKEITQTLLNKTYPYLLPNTIAAIQNFSGLNKSQNLKSTYGVKTRLTLAGQYKRNIELMNAIATSQNAKFFGFLQPNAYFSSKHEALLKQKRGKTYISNLVKLYTEITSSPMSLSYLHNATRIFEDHDGVYKDDGIHVTSKGDSIIANFVFETISKEGVFGINADQ